MRRVLATTVAVVCTMATVAACGDDSGGGSDGGSGGSGTTEPATIEVTFEGDTVTPNGERVEVKVDQPVDLVVEADQPGEIHVHSSPEQSFTYSEGTETFKMQFERPGVVEVESHDLEQVIVQLEIS